MSTEVDAAIDLLRDKLPGFAAALALAQSGIDSWLCLPPESYHNKDVLDLGCGLGAATALLRQRGARSVWGIDPMLTDEQLALLAALPQGRFTSAVLSREPFGTQQFDLVYSHLTTEHILDLPDAFSTVFELLRPGGRFVSLHDNYYGPLGQHDQSFIGGQTTKAGEMFFRALSVPCWESSAKCAASLQFRTEIERLYDWTVASWRLTPQNCRQCPYYCRSQLWAHIRYQDDYNHIYPGDFFKTNASGGLNKVTPFQLRQFLVEAGFHVSHWQITAVKNKVPSAIRHILMEQDLRTAQILFAADKPATSAELAGSKRIFNTMQVSAETPKSRSKALFASLPQPHPDSLSRFHAGRLRSHDLDRLRLARRDPAPSAGPPPRSSSRPLNTRCCSRITRKWAGMWRR
ncbi:MAG: class I SAM-dependent methyltransferase [Deltaproteobacteria bacterium]|nr:class I SAM-dependent methyltransferase [Deltaproteobacteria bacterium]